VSEIQGIARFKLGPGEAQEFKQVSAQCLEVVRAKDTGTLQYDIYLNDDESEAFVVERYRDSDALIEHVANLGDLMQAIMSVGSIEGEVLGDLSPELDAQLAGGPVRVFRPYLSL